MSATLVVWGSLAALQQITGFSAVRWGAPRDEIVAAWGTPAAESVEPGLLGRRLLFYRTRLLDEPATVTFELDPTKGLIAGEYWVFPCAAWSERSCVGKFEREIRAKYPALAPSRASERPGARPGARDSALAAARTWGDTEAMALRYLLDSAAVARWELVWADLRSGARIRLRPMLEGLGAIIRYEAADYAKLRRALDKVERRARF